MDEAYKQAYEFARFAVELERNPPNTFHVKGGAPSEFDFAEQANKGDWCLTDSGLLYINEGERGSPKWVLA